MTLRRAALTILAVIAIVAWLIHTTPPRLAECDRDFGEVRTDKCGGVDGE